MGDRTVLIRKWGAACAAAFQFLTRLPVPLALNYDERLFRRSVLFYPAVGAMLGLLLAAAGWLAAACLPPDPAAALLVAVWVALTGALHLDGLMDTADGLLSHRPRERMLEIMKDSRVGAMGVVACVLVLLLKWSLVRTLLDALPDEHSAAVLAGFPVCLIWSRWAMVAAIARYPYARTSSEGGLGAYFRGVGLRHSQFAGLGAAAVTAAVLWLGPGALDLSVRGVLYAIGGTAAAALAAAAGGWIVNRYISRKLGGLTGDTYGALNELLEAGLLLLWVAVWPFL